MALIHNLLYFEIALTLIISSLEGEDGVGFFFFPFSLIQFVYLDLKNILNLFLTCALQGDKLEIIVLNASGIRQEYMELRKD